MSRKSVRTAGYKPITRNAGKSELDGHTKRIRGVVARGIDKQLKLGQRTRAKPITRQQARLEAVKNYRALHGALRTSICD